MMASGGQVRVSTWDGELLQDEHALPDETLFKLVFMKQVGSDGHQKNEGDVFTDWLSLGNLTSCEGAMLEDCFKSDLSRIQQLPHGVSASIAASDTAIGTQFAC